MDLPLQGQRKRARRPFFWSAWRRRHPGSRQSVALAAHDAQQGEQALEHVDDVQVQRKRGADVVGFTAVDDLLQVVQHVGAEHADGHDRDRHHAGSGADKDVDDATDQDGQRADEQPLAHARQVTLDHARQAGHDEEDACGAAESRHDQVRAVLEAQHHGDHAREHQAHEEGEAQQHRHAGSGILGLVDGVDEAEGAAQEHDQAQAAAQRLGDACGHAQPGAQHGGQQAQRQQPVGVAQDLVALNLRGNMAETRALVNGLHPIIHVSDSLLAAPCSRRSVVDTENAKRFPDRDSFRLCGNSGEERFALDRGNESCLKSYAHSF